MFKLSKHTPDSLNYTEGNYLSIYNETTKEYNTPITNNGKYKIHVMKYAPDSKTLEIHIYTHIAE